MDYKQLLTVGDCDKVPSSSQLWFHLVNLAVWILYVSIGVSISYRIWGGADNGVQLLTEFTWLTGVVTSIITGNKFANKLIEFKLGGKNANTNNP
jgi:hypothetical protein